MHRKSSGTHCYHPPSPSPLTERGLGGEVSLHASQPVEGESGGKVKWHTPPFLWEKLKPLAREMRHAPTPAEEILWQYLRNRKIMGYNFRRQHAIDRFILDFYCSELMLCIEVEGDIHQYTREEDGIRSEFLESLGIIVLKFPNGQIIQNLESVLEKIRAVITTRQSEY